MRERKVWRDVAVGNVLLEFRSRRARPLGLVVFAELVFGHCIYRRGNWVQGRNKRIV